MSQSEFVQLLAPQLDNAFRLAYVMLGSRQEAEDAVQQATLNAWRRSHQLSKTDSSFGAWFRAIVVNQCHSTRRNRWWSVLQLSNIEATGTDVAMDRLPDVLDLRMALRRLRADDRLLLACQFYFDYSAVETARILRISPAAAKSRIHRALCRLRRILKANEVIAHA